ncbi:hypothetical protein C0075_24050, partial [Rhizobium sp. KAs_5_22]
MVAMLRILRPSRLPAGTRRAERQSQPMAASTSSTQAATDSGNQRERGISDMAPHFSPVDPWMKKKIPTGVGMHEGA